MRRSAATVVAVFFLLAPRPAPAADGKHFDEVKLKTRTGVTVARAALDERGQVRFGNVAPGEYELVLTDRAGRSVSVGDLDGDGRGDLVVRGSGGGAGKVNVQDLSVASADPVAREAAAPRDAASGMASGKRQHRPLTLLVNWSTGQVQGGFPTTTATRAAAQRTPGCPAACSGVAIDVDSGAGTITVESWSFGATQSGSFAQSR